MKKKINQSPENCCKLMRALALSQDGVFVEELTKSPDRWERMNAQSAGIV